MTERGSRLRALLAACMLIACFALAACGGDDDKDDGGSGSDTAAESTPTEETATEEAPPEETATEEPTDDGSGGDFAEQGNAICQQAQDDVNQLVEADPDDVGGPVARIQQMVTELSELTPPEDQQETFDQLIQLAQEQNAEAMRIVEDGGTAEDVGALDDSELDALATELGLDTCAA